eukprot:COSAG04_NODE_594_length_12270_cov_52.568975_4_plen_404_part_00
MPMAAVSAHPILQSSSRGELLPAGWSVHRSRTHDREYWFNETTGETKWTPPSPPPRESPSPEADLGGSWAGLFSGGSATASQLWSTGSTDAAGVGSSATAWWGSTTHAYDGVRVPNPPTTPQHSASSPSLRGVRDQARRSLASGGSLSRGSASTSRLPTPASGGARSPRSPRHGGGHSPRKPHEFAVKLPIEARQGDGGISATIRPWLGYHGASLPRDFKHVLPVPSPPKVKIKPSPDQDFYEIGDTVCLRPGVASLAFGGSIEEIGGPDAVGVVVQHHRGEDVLVQWGEPLNARVWSTPAELRLVAKCTEEERDALLEDERTARRRRQQQRMRWRAEEQRESHARAREFRRRFGTVGGASPRAARALDSDIDFDGAEAREMFAHIDGEPDRLQTPLLAWLRC